VTKRRPSVSSRAWDLPIAKMLRGRPAMTRSCLELFGDLLVRCRRRLSKISRHQANIPRRRDVSGTAGACDRTGV
jgi:hypothetical protein